MPQMSPMMWVSLLLLMMFTYLSITNFIGVHSNTFTSNKKMPNKKSSMEW